MQDGIDGNKTDPAQSETKLLRQLISPVIFRLGSFAADLSLEIFRLGTFVWELSLGDFAWEITLGNFRLETVAWEL